MYIQTIKRNTIMKKKNFFYNTTEPTMDKNKLFQSIFKTYVSTYPLKSKQECQQQVVEEWNKIKNKENLLEAVENWLGELRRIQRLQKGSLHTFWAKQCEKDTSTQNLSAPSTSSSSNIDLNKYNDQNKVSVADSSTRISSTLEISRKRPAFVQLQLQQEIDVVNADMVGLFERKKVGLISDQQEKDLSAKKN